MSYPTTLCKRCRARVIWTRRDSEDGRFMLVDAETSPTGEFVLTGWSTPVATRPTKNDPLAAVRQGYSRHTCSPGSTL